MNRVIFFVALLLVPLSLRGAGIVNDYSRDLISCWTLDERSGTRRDSFGTNHLIENGIVDSNRGKIGNAADFVAGRHEFLSRADNGDLSTGNIDFTIAFWVRFDALPAYNYFVLKKWTSAATGEYLFYTSGTTLNWRVVDTFSSAGEVSVTSLSTGTWYYVVGWHDSVNDQIGMSVNSAAPVTTSWTRGVRDSIDTFTIGNNAMYGRIDEVAFWKRILSPDERTRLYNSGNGTACGAVTALFTAKPIETVGGLND